jgi:hypothetical protein
LPCCMCDALTQGVTERLIPHVHPCVRLCLGEALSSQNAIKFCTQPVLGERSVVHGQGSCLRRFQEGSQKLQSFRRLMLVTLLQINSCMSKACRELVLSQCPASSLMLEPMCKGYAAASVLASARSCHHRRIIRRPIGHSLHCSLLQCMQHHTTPHQYSSAAHGRDIYCSPCLYAAQVVVSQAL